jgi:hypothetical protein
MPCVSSFSSTVFGGSLGAGAVLSGAGASGGGEADCASRALGSAVAAPPAVVTISATMAAKRRFSGMEAPKASKR